MSLGNLRSKTASKIGGDRKRPSLLRSITGGGGQRYPREATHWGGGEAGAPLLQRIGSWRHFSAGPTPKGEGTGRERYQDTLPHYIPLTKTNTWDKPEGGRHRTGSTSNTGRKATEPSVHHGATHPGLAG